MNPGPYMWIRASIYRDGANYISSGITESNDYIFKSISILPLQDAYPLSEGLHLKAQRHIRTVHLSWPYQRCQCDLQYLWTMAIGVVAAASDYNIIAGNKITCDTSWASGTIPEAEGIVFSDGSHNLVLRKWSHRRFSLGYGQEVVRELFSPTIHTSWLPGHYFCVRYLQGIFCGWCNNQNPGSSISWLGAYNTSHDNSFVVILWSMELITTT